MRWVGHVARMEAMRNAYKILVGRREGQSPLGRPRHRWEDIRMNFREIGKVWIGCIWLRIGAGGGLF